MNTVDKTIRDLCDDVDYWKARAEHLEFLLSEARQKYNDKILEDIRHSHAVSAGMLQLALRKA